MIFVLERLRKTPPQAAQAAALVCTWLAIAMLLLAAWYLLPADRPGSLHGIIPLLGVTGGLLALSAITQHQAAAPGPASRFQRAFSLGNGILRDGAGRITFWSEGAERLFGYTPKEALHRTAHALLQTEFPRPLAEIDAALQRDLQWKGNLGHRHRDGSLLHIAAHWALHRGKVGGPHIVIEINNDITALVRAEAELRESDVTLRLALDASGQGTWRWDVGNLGSRLEWDARCKTLFGLPRDARVTYATWVEAVLPEDRAMPEARINRALDPAEPDDHYEAEYRVRRSDGTIVWIASAGQAIFTPDADAPSGRRAVRILGTSRDVSSTKHIEQRADALLRTIVEAAPGLIYAKDRFGKVILINQPALDLIGRPREQVEGRTDLEFLGDPVQAAAVMENDRRVMESGRTEGVEERIGSDSTQRNYWFSTKAPLRDANGAVIGLVGISVDITDRKLAEDRLRVMINELNHRVKNTLATVQAIAAHTLRGADQTIRQRLEGRLVALAGAHDVLSRENWEGVALADIVTGALAACSGANAERVKISGPALRLCPRAALALALGLHELATNAVKHGALSVDTGEIGIHWEIAKTPAPSLRLVWSERFGPVVAAPVQRGFGIRLVERSLAQDLGGTASVSFEDPDGIVCRIESPLAQIAAPVEVVPFPRVGGARGEKA